VRDGRLLVLLELVERDAEVAVRRRHVGIDLDRAPRLVGGEFWPAGEPQHLAEVGAKERDLRGDLDRAPHVLDRLAELAALVGDDAEQVGGLGQVRLGVERAAAQRFGLHQPALAAVAIGQHERLAERYELLAGGPREMGHGPCR